MSCSCANQDSSTKRQSSFSGIAEVSEDEWLSVSIIFKLKVHIERAGVNMELESAQEHNSHRNIGCLCFVVVGFADLVALFGCF
jgi:hypothetical protein